MRMSPYSAAVIVATAACLLALGTTVNAAQDAGPTFRLMSPDLPAGKPIAEMFVADTFGCHGANESPALKWSNAPAGTKSFVIDIPFGKSSIILVKDKKAYSRIIHFTPIRTS